MKRVDPNTVAHRKTLRGRDEVTYDCPNCQASLKNDLSDAGIRDSCPHCGCEFFVPGDERLDGLKQAESQGKLRKKEEAEESKRNQEQADKRIRELELVAKNREQEQERQKVLLKSTHYMSLGFMHLVSVLTKGIWLAILVFMQTVTSVIWLFSSVIGAAVGGEAGDAGRAIRDVSSLIVILLTIGIAILSAAQIMDVFRARDAFRSGSDPEKTSD
jgi:hypothetical protein